MPTIQQLASDDDRVIILATFERMTPAQLFDAFTQPDNLPRWWGSRAEIEPRVGGAYHFAWDAMNWHLRGRYSEFVPGERLAFTWRWDHEPDRPERSVAIDFAAADGGAELTLTHGFYTLDDADERAEHVEGWLHFLPKLQNLER